MRGIAQQPVDFGGGALRVGKRPKVKGTGLKKRPLSDQNVEETKFPQVESLRGDPISVLRAGQHVGAQGFRLAERGGQDLSRREYLGAQSVVQRASFGFGFFFPRGGLEPIAAIAVEDRERHREAENRLIAFDLFVAFQPDPQGEIRPTPSLLQRSQGSAALDLETGPLQVWGSFEASLEGLPAGYFRKDVERAFRPLESRARIAPGRRQLLPGGGELAREPASARSGRWRAPPGH